MMDGTLICDEIQADELESEAECQARDHHCIRDNLVVYHESLLKLSGFLVLGKLIEVMNAETETEFYS